MSSPADRPIDPRDPSAYAPKWARDPATAERRNAARQRSVSELTNSDFSGSATTESWFADDATPTERCPIRPSLDPIVLPAPPFRPRARFPFSIVGLTVAAAAVAVLLAVGKLQPWSVVAMDDSLEIASFDSRFIEQPTPTSITDRETFPSSSQLAGVKVAARPIDDKTLLGETLSGSETHRVTNTMTKPAGPTRAALDPEAIAVLVTRGQELLATGDIAAARVVLLRAAEAHDPGAALAVAATYDPILLEKIGVFGTDVADIRSARNWYEKAKELGSQEAPRRLEMLAGRER
jgi:hypothetical protein